MAKQQVETGERVFISIIIPARNEEEFLPATIRALQHQTYRNFEIIVVANGCTDRTAEVARELGCRVFELGARGLGPARNLGGREAKGQLLAFLDADTLLTPNALERIADRFTRKHACGTVWGEPDGMKVSHRLIYALKNLIHASHAHTGSSGVILCWKDQFEAVGGFDEKLYLRENSHLMKRLRRFGRYRFLWSAVAVTSMRRYESHGTLEMMRLWTNVWLKSLFSDIHNETYEDLQGEAANRQLARARERQREKAAI